MRGVRLLGFIKPMTEAYGWQRRAAPSQADAQILGRGRASDYPPRGVAGGADFEFHGSRQVRAVLTTHPNKPMHPTADTNDVISSNRAGRRVIGGVRLLRRLKPSCLNQCLRLVSRYELPERHHHRTRQTWR